MFCCLKRRPDVTNNCHLYRIKDFGSQYNRLHYFFHLVFILSCIPVNSHQLTVTNICLQNCMNELNNTTKHNDIINNTIFGSDISLYTNLITQSTLANLQEILDTSLNRTLVYLLEFGK